MASRFSQMQSGLQKRIQVDALDRNLCAQWIGIGKPDGATAGNLPRAHGRTQLEMRRMPIGRQAAVETADDLLADAEIHDAKSSIAERCDRRTTGFQLETDLPSHREERRLQFLEILKRQRRAGKFCGQRLVSITIAYRTGNDPCAASAFLSRREEAQLRIGNARFLLRNAQLSAQAIKREPVNISLREVKQSRNTGLLACAAPMKLTRQQAAYRVGPAGEPFDAFDRGFFEIDIRRPLVLR